MWRAYLLVASGSATLGELCDALGPSSDDSHSIGDVPRRPRRVPSQAPPPKPFDWSKWTRPLWWRASRFAGVDGITRAVSTLPEDLADRLRARADVGDTVRLVVVQDMDGRAPIGARGFYLQPLALAWLARAGAALDIDQYADLVDEPDEVDFDHRPPLDLEWWRDRMVASVRLIESSSAELEGYEVGSNGLVPAPGPRSSAAQTRWDVLDALYQVIDEVSLPGVHIGYWIHPAKWLSEAEERLHPTSVVAAGMTRKVVTFGSDGGGGLFAFALDSGEILHLHPSEIRDGTRLAETAPREVAPDLDAFLRKLLDVVDELVETGDTAGI